MLKKTITFENFDGDTVTETHYFNLSQTELIELELEYAGGIERAVTNMIEAKRNRELFAAVKQIVLSAYGIKSDDGKRFIKNDQIREEFTQTPAFDALMVELGTNEDAAAKFIIGVMPKAAQEGIDERELKQKMAERLGTSPSAPKTTAELAAETAGQ